MGASLQVQHLVCIAEWNTVSEFVFCWVETFRKLFSLAWQTDVGLAQKNYACAEGGKLALVGSW
jgi:hypothetical protein